ncbi:MAG: TIGR00269 family protein, partial [Nanopusillaceae archaeon]
VAYETKSTSVATGHNADDIMVYALKSILIHDYASLSKLVPKTENVLGGIPHIRPLYETYEREIFLYAIANNLPFVPEPCPFRPKDMYIDFLRNFIEELERKQPGIKIRFLRGLEEYKENYRSMVNKKYKYNRCKICGLISSSNICSFDRFTKNVFGIYLGPHVKNIVKSKIKDTKFSL